MTRQQAMLFYKTPADLATAAKVGRSAVYQWGFNKPMPELSARRVIDDIKEKGLEPIFNPEYAKLKEMISQMSDIEHLKHFYDVPGGGQESQARTNDN